MKSVMAHSFSQVPQADIQRSSFNRSHGYKTAFDSGYLIPIFVDEALPGDSLNLRMSAFCRLSTPIKPIMDNLFLDSFFFAVPNRLLWTNWEKFNGAQTNPGDSTSYLVPQMQAPGAGGVTVGSLSDYIGIPTGINSILFDSLWHRAYNLIWNTWFRDENLQNSVTVDTGDGPDTYTNYVLLRRGKRHDYFTSSLPFPQKGTAVTIPLGTSATVKTNASDLLTGAQNPIRWLQSAAGALPGASALITTGAGAAATNINYSATAGTSQGTSLYPTNLFADLTGATAATINALRQAFQIQRMYERDARGGTRYTEILKAHFGVTSPDARLQRPEYLGGGSSPINIHPVAQTTPTPAAGTTTPQGNLAAFGTGGFTGHGFTKSFTEHCTLIGLVSVRADLNYQQGLDRMFSRRTRFDYYWPALSHIGEQAVLNQEIYMDGSANDALTFSYQERYAEYRFKSSKITGIFRSTAAGTLDYWHLAQKFTSLPALNSTFIQDTPPVSRVVVTSSEPQIIFDSHFDYICARPMPVFGVPGMIDHL
ncbi:MAG: major capsid protein [Microviridae sp.]|nr:MAG: major capsid protein [Microviridae sp.]